MMRTAHVVPLGDAVSDQFVAVPVVFDDGVGYLSPVIPTEVSGVRLSREIARDWCARHGLSAEVGSVAVLRSMSGPAVILVSLGASYNVAESYRVAAAAAVRVAGSGPLSILLPVEAIEQPGVAAQCVVEGALLAGYRYKDDAVTSTLGVAPVADPLPSVTVHDDVTEGVRRGLEVAEAVNWAKHLINTPAGDLTPKDLAKRFVDELDGCASVSVEVWTESKIKEEGLGGLLGVGLGSAQPTRLVRAIYDPAPDRDLPHVALVGKGVTFDSGGLSLKPADSMMSMKTDMTGAAVVMATLRVASRLGLALRVSAITPLTENLVGERATKPGDVLTMRNGMTVEVLNTDAEGRLILADALCLAVESKPDAIVDVATLTGAQNVALGDEVGAFYATTDDLAERLIRASAHSGEQLWRMPLVDAYETHIDSDVADMKNIGKPPRAGSIVAALMLRRFTKGRPWAHLDIAGPARCDAARGYVTKGATAFSTRALIEFLRGVAESD